MFGFATISIDAKGRLAVPAKYRKQLCAQNEESIVVTRDPQYPALKIYPGSIWKNISTELQRMSPYNNFRIRYFQTHDLNFSII